MMTNVAEKQKITNLIGDYYSWPCKLHVGGNKKLRTGKSGVYESYCDYDFVLSP